MHGSIQIVSAAFAALGLLVVIGMHTATGRSNVGGDDVAQSWKIHTWLGYTSAFFLMAQVCCVCAGAGVRVRVRAHVVDKM